MEFIEDAMGDFENVGPTFLSWHSFLSWFEETLLINFCLPSVNRSPLLSRFLLTIHDINPGESLRIFRKVFLSSLLEFFPGSLNDPHHFPQGPLEFLA